MQILIHLNEEVSLATIKDNRQIPVLNLINLIDYSMRIPYFLVRFIIPQAFCHVPILRERTNVYASTCTSTSAKGIFMTDSSPQTTMSAHTQTGNGTPLAVGDCLVMSVDILHQFR